MFTILEVIFFVQFYFILYGLYMSSSNKTKRRHSNKHKHTKRHIHNKTHKHHKMHSKRRLYRKRREIRLVPGSKSVPLFSSPEKKQNTPILENSSQMQGNIIQGLRTYLNHKI